MSPSKGRPGMDAPSSSRNEQIANEADNKSQFIEDHRHHAEMGEILEEDGIMEEAVEGEILHDDLIHEGELMEDGAEIEIEYVEDDGIVGAEEEIVMDGEEMVIEEDELATQSLVALSRGAEHKTKSVRDFIRDSAPHQGHQGKLQSPRILRRATAVPRQMYDPSPRMTNHNLGNMNHMPRPNYPVPLQTKRLLPVATVQSGAGPSKTPTSAEKQRDWREEQKRMLEIYEIYDCLPDHMREPFKRVLESRSAGGLESLPAKALMVTPKRMPIGQQAHTSHTQMRLIDPRDPYANDRMMIQEETIPHHSSYKYKEREEHARDGDQEMCDAKEHLRLMKDQEQSMNTEELVDMPQLEEAPPRQGGDAQIDVEGYDSGDDADIRAGIEYVMEAEEQDIYNSRANRKRNFSNHMRQGQIIMPEMREEYFGGMDVSNYSASAIMMNNQIQESRYCPGCKMTLKRSIFYHHSRMIKKYGVCNMFTPKRFPCGWEGCEERLGTVEKLCEHMWQIHGAPTDIKTEILHDEQEFDAFLRELEGKGGNFRMSRGNKMIKAGLVQYYRCNRMQSVSKDRTLRTCDEISMYGQPISERDRRMHTHEADPFASHGGKPCLRTEEACTAFFRKAYLPNGTIEVRYCDHHLHEDERVRLPLALKNRILEMYNKRLPAAVIMMVLQNERDNFCQPGSAVERRILALTPKDITNTLMSKPKIRKSRYAQPPLRNSTVANTPTMQTLQTRRAQVEVQSVEDNNGNGSISQRTDEESLEEDVSRDITHSANGGNNESTLSEDVEVDVEDGYDATGPEDRSTLTDLEQRMLEAFEANHEVILTDMQKQKRLENKKRHQREAIRSRVYAMGRYIKTMNFADMSLEQLDEMHNYLKKLAELTHAKVDGNGMSMASVGGCQYPIHHMPLALKREEGETEEIVETEVVDNNLDSPSMIASPPRRRRKRQSTNTVDEPSVRNVAADNATPSYRGNVSADENEEEPCVDVLSEARSEDVMERIVVDDIPPTPKKRRGRPRKEVKKEAADEDEFVDPVPPPPTAAVPPPSRTRTGRVVRPRTIIDV